MSVKVGLELPEALAAIQEAIGICGPLAEQSPEAFGTQLWLVFRTLADVLDSLGRSDETTDLRRRLDQVVEDQGDEVDEKPGPA